MTISRITAGGRTPPELRRARLATATLFFANGCGLGSWLPHIPDVKIWHGLSDGVLGLPPAPHVVIAAVMLGAAVLAAWPVLLPTAPPRGRLAVLGAVALIAFMAEGALSDRSAIYIRRNLGASPATAAWGFAAFSLTMAIGRFSGDRLVARFSPAGRGGECLSLYASALLLVLIGG